MPLNMSVTDNDPVPLFGSPSARDDRLFLLSRFEDRRPPDGGPPDPSPFDVGPGPTGWTGDDATTPCRMSFDGRRFVPLEGPNPPRGEPRGGSPSFEPAPQEVLLLLVVNDPAPSKDGGLSLKGDDFAK